VAQAKWVAWAACVRTLRAGREANPCLRAPRLPRAKPRCAASLIEHRYRPGVQRPVESPSAHRVSAKVVSPHRAALLFNGETACSNRTPLAHVRTSGGPTSPTQRQFRVARSSPNLCARPSLTRSNRRWYGPVCPVVWEGWRREASPYPDQLLVFRSFDQNRSKH
jgi:hypothetical protein